MGRPLVGTRVRTKDAYCGYERVGDAEGVLSGYYHQSLGYDGEVEVEVEFYGDDSRTFHAPMDSLEIMPSRKGGKKA